MKDGHADERYMKRVIRLAQKGRGRTSPNPLVGALVVKDGRIVGEGYHQQFGGPHAEIFALEEAGEQARGATLYVNLEPCSHHGKTPPCVDRVIASGISRVVIGNKDPNPLVNGHGIRKLQDAGIEVKLAVLAEESRRLNEAYFKFICTGRPLVVLKWAQTLDGKIATVGGDSFWISGEASRKTVHALRSAVDAILVGAGTINRDNPQLTVRHVRGRQPWRLILDGKLRMRPDATVLRDRHADKTVVFTAEQNQQKIAAIAAKGAKVVTLPANSAGEVDLREVMDWLANHRIISVLVEGGQEVLTGFLRADLADKLLIYVAPKIIGNGIAAVGDLGIRSMDNAIKLRKIGCERIDSDFLFEAYLKEIPCLQD